MAPSNGLWRLDREAVTAATVRDVLRAFVCATLLGGTGACAEPAEDSRAALIQGAMVRAELPLLRTRPDHVAGKYARMARSLYDFYRGTVPVFRADFDNGELDASRTRFAIDDLLVLSTGDAHPENFGLLLAGDGTLAVEPNDFDSADRYPYHWDLRRLGTGLVLGAWLARPEDDRNALGTQVAAAAARGYAQEIQRQASGYDRFRVDVAGDVPHFADLFRRGTRDLAARAELSELTQVRDGVRRILRGAPSSSEPEEVLLDLPPDAVAALEDTLRRANLPSPRPPQFFAVKDAVRQLGSGVASWPRVRVLVLVEGPTTDLEDDVLLEVKELIDSGAGGWIPPRRHHDDVAMRIQQTSRALWSRPDGEALWGTSDWLGLQVQVRLESEAHKTLRIDRFEDELAEVDALEALAARLGELLARMHATPLREEANPAARIAGRIADDLEGFVTDHAAGSVGYAARVELDFVTWRRLVCAEPILGARRLETDVPSVEVLRLLADPVPVERDFCSEER